MRAGRWIVGVIIGLMLAGCDYARMTSDEAHDTYEAHFPVMPPDSIGTAGGTAALRLGGPGNLKNPLKRDDLTIGAGLQAYINFCVHCHGAQADGRGTVGQSFAPLPTDLGSRQVQRQSDGELFYKIGFGFERHPPLIHSMMENDIWAVIIVMRDTAR